MPVQNALLPVRVSSTARTSSLRRNICQIERNSVIITSSKALYTSGRLTSA